MFVAALIALGAFVHPVGASMLGEEVRIRHEFPAVGSIFNGRDNVVTVAAGPGDEIIYGGIRIDVEATRIIYTRVTSAVFAGPYNGIVVSAIDNISIGSFDILSTFGGIDAQRIGFGASEITVDLAGIGGSLGQFLEIQLNPVPLPGALVLFGSALSLAFAKRRKR